MKSRIIGIKRMLASLDAWHFIYVTDLQQALAAPTQPDSTTYAVTSGN